VVKKIAESAATPDLTATQKNLIHLASICFLENTLVNGSFPKDIFCLILVPFLARQNAGCSAGYYYYCYYYYFNIVM